MGGFGRLTQRMSEQPVFTSPSKLTSESVVPATTAVRFTFVLALPMTVLITVITGGPSDELAWYWLSTIALAYLGWSSRPSEAVRGVAVCASWWMTGAYTLFGYGIAGGSAILVVAVALVGLFFGARPAVAVSVLSAVVMGAIGAGHVTGVLAPDDLEQVSNTAATMWIAQTANFVMLAAMIALVQVAVLRRANSATARARYFALAAERSDSSVIITGPDARIEWTNEAFTRLTGYTQAEAYGKAPGALLQGPGSSAVIRDQMRDGVRAGQPFNFDIVNYTKSRRPYWIRIEVRPFYDASGELLGFSGIQTDITVERMRAALDGAESDLAERLAGATDPDAVRASLLESLAGTGPVICGRVWRWEEAGAQCLSGRQVISERFPAEMFERLASLVPPPTSAPMPSMCDVRASSLPIPHATVACAFPHDPQLFVELCVDDDVPGRSELAERLPRLVVMADQALQRVAGQRALEEALVECSRALAEREVLLKEIHHRVKNNLQIVSSLLGMQSDRMTSDEARRGLDDSVFRVRSMALIHELLYGGRDLTHVDLGGYARSLSVELRGALAPGAQLSIEVSSAQVAVEQAIPCGLLLNELITNALKHGRSPDGVCRVSVEVRREPSTIRVVVSDEGPGLPEDFAQRRRASLGMKIVDALVKQLGARFTMSSGSGARFELTVPNNEIATATR
jgi:PAS domain S-box-containing protein